MRDASRRRVLGLSGTALVTALAGCGIPGGGEGDEADDGEGDDGQAEDGGDGEDDGAGGENDGTGGEDGGTGGEDGEGTEEEDG